MGNFFWYTINQYIGYYIILSLFKHRNFRHKKIYLQINKYIMAKTISEKQLMQEFKKFDINQDGFISVYDLKYVLKMVDIEFSDEGVELMIAVVDLDGDGQINYEEFVKLISMIDANENCKIDYEEFVAWKNLENPIVEVDVGSELDTVVDAESKQSFYDIVKLAIIVNKIAKK